MVGSLVSWRAVCAAPRRRSATPDGFAGFGHSPRDSGWQEYFLKLFHVGMMHRNSHVDENCGKQRRRGRGQKSWPSPQVIDGCPTGCRGLSAHCHDNLFLFMVIQHNPPPSPLM
ncbi:hypothetical protein DA2_2851 [Desulfovibrio sp. A2]|nr:hypothetical protein DA2_2851 [Desulfovibrio sp. A2]